MGGTEKQTLQDFRTQLAWALIENDYLDTEEAQQSGRRKRRMTLEHNLVTAPKGATKWDDKIGFSRAN